MPTHKSAWKRMRQNEERRIVNKAHRTSLRRAVKSYREIEGTEVAKERFPQIASTIDKAAKKGIIHHRKASRMKSRLSRKTAGA
jgi:small subunit ribosomal protein S20